MMMMIRLYVVQWWRSVINLGGPGHISSLLQSSISPLLPSLSLTPQGVWTEPAAKHFIAVYTVKQPYKYTMLTNTQGEIDDHAGRAEVG